MEVSKKKKPKKPYCLVALVLLFVGTAQAQTVQDKLVGLGMNEQLADYLAGIIPAGAALDNGTYLKGNNQAGSADINLIGIDSSDNTIVNSSASDSLILQLEDDASRLITFNAASDTVLTMKFGDAGTTATQSLTLSSGNSDADDDSSLYIAGGGNASNSRGAWLSLDGNETAGGGDLSLKTGDASGSDLILSLNHSASAVSVRDASTTPIATFNQTEGLVTAAGKYINSTAYVPTPVATPVLGTNQVLPGLNIVPTAAANTAMWLGASTPVPGQQFKIYNNAGNAVRIKGAGAATINGGTAGKYIEMAAASYMECMTLTTAIQQCPFYSVNGAVAAVPTPA